MGIFRANERSTLNDHANYSTLMNYDLMKSFYVLINSFLAFMATRTKAADEARAARTWAKILLTFYFV